MGVLCGRHAHPAQISHRLKEISTVLAVCDVALSAQQATTLFTCVVVDALCPEERAIGLQRVFHMLPLEPAVHTSVGAARAALAVSSASLTMLRQSGQAPPRGWEEADVPVSATRGRARAMTRLD